ncbi:BON domain-containing protein [Dechloromonas sp. A34]|uniref:BON domain-containing protein n=1 Tax=Dechloromonas sp. A34 TaxID=447588 RepID=UPI0022499CAF|nr:BON domain-containing protein [Dechloromonas sp. A34]
MTGNSATDIKTKALLALCGSILAGGLMLGGCERANTEPASQVPSAAAPRSNDDAINARVKARLASDAELLPLPIAVETQDGRVTLRGVVPQAMIARAEQLVGNVEGVRAVDNRLEPAAAS